MFLVISQIYMIQRIQVFIVFSFIQVVVIAAWTNPNDDSALQSLRKMWENESPNWVGSDPCGNKWEGISCNNGSRVHAITLSSIGLSGELSGDIQGLTELSILDLSYNKDLTGNLPESIGNLKKLTNLVLVGCNFSGRIPESIGSLKQLVFLALNSNNFIGQIPAAIGQLSNLMWLDLADNKLSGSIPISNGSEPGLDMLVNTKHFHFGRNQLSGGIPAELFTPNMTLIHLLLESNQLVGSIPDTLGFVRNLEVVRLDNNSLSGPVPKNLSNLKNVSELYLSNNDLVGPLPDLTGMISLNYVDMSNNSFDPSDIPLWFSTLQALTTLIMERTNIQGQLPAALFSLPQLQTVILRDNNFSGTLHISSNYSNQLQVIDLRYNAIATFIKRRGYDFQLLLLGNPYCQEGGNEKYCSDPQFESPYSTPPDNCLPTACSSNQASSPTCKCAYPYTGNLFFRAPLFYNLRNSSNYVLLEQSMVQSFQKDYFLPVDSVSLSNATRGLTGYLEMHLQVFPSTQDHFERTGVSIIGNILSFQVYKPPKIFGPFYFSGDTYRYFEVASKSPSASYSPSASQSPGASPSPEASPSSHKSSSVATAIGASIGSFVLVLLILLAGIYAFWRKKIAHATAKMNGPFESWGPNNDNGGVPQIKGLKRFSLEELKKYTDNCSDINEIGSGGYGKVYRGTLPNGQLVAIKRARQGSVQGALEFKTEIELLSRVHHKYVLKLEGFCFEQGEQILVYEYIPNGTLKDSLSGNSGIKLDWMKRLQIALGAARGLQYLHDLADPPIIHRDIKSNNILLDECLNAKVADFGISKPFELDRGYVTTQVKGTPGYLDPEYYMSQQLTEKSDVYSFGVVLLELITARSPFEKGIYIVKEVREMMDKSKDLYNLQSIIDPTLGLSMPPRSLEKFMDLAMRCVEEAGVNRPTMNDVLKEIENIMELVGLNPNVELVSITASDEGVIEDYNRSYSNSRLFALNGGHPYSKVETV